MVLIVTRSVLIWVTEAFPVPTNPSSEVTEEVRRSFKLPISPSSVDKSVDGALAPVMTVPIMLLADARVAVVAVRRSIMSGERVDMTPKITISIITQ